VRVLPSLLLALFVSFYLLSKGSPRWASAGGKVSVEGVVISVKPGSVLLLQNERILWRLKGVWGVYPGDGLLVEGKAYGALLYAEEFVVKRSKLQSLRVEVHTFLKDRFKASVRDGFELKLGSALIFGENWFSKGELERVAEMGIYHLLVISGMHYALFMTFFLLFPLRWKLRYFAALVFFTFFTFLVLFPKAPAYRAFVSVALLLAAKILERRYDALRALLFAYSAWLLLNPHWFYNYGFWLSYLASAALILYYGGRKTPEEGYLKNFFSRLLGLEASLVVMATISPVLAYKLQYLPLDTFVYGFIFTLAVQVFILAATANFLTLWSFDPLWRLQNWAADLFEFLFEKLSPVGVLCFAEPPRFQAFLFPAVALALLLLPLERKKKLLLLGILFAFEALLFWQINPRLYFLLR